MWWRIRDRFWWAGLDQSPGPIFTPSPSLLECCSLLELAGASFSSYLFLFLRWVSFLYHYCIGEGYVFSILDILLELFTLSVSLFGPISGFLGANFCRGCFSQMELSLSLSVCLSVSLSFSVIICKSTCHYDRHSQRHQQL